MPYITVFVEPKPYQISFEDILYGCTDDLFKQTKDIRDTRTYLTNSINDKLLERTNFHAMIYALASFNERYQSLIETEDKSSLYRSFKIPKRSGGLRQIDAPQAELMEALRALKLIFETRLYASYHTSAFAYVKNRSTIDAVKRHQSNKSRWFLKLDFSNFFGSTTPEFVMNQLAMIFPYCIIINDPRGKEALRKALSLCFLNGGLPQGTPISPLLTNLMMIPIDHAIAHMAQKHTPHMVYTRYADDILLSSDISFNYEEVQKEVMSIIRQFNAPFNIKPEKTRYGSSAGRNWNLGVMLNKDNQITIGHSKKKQFKAMVFSLMTDDAKGIVWSVEDAQVLGGLISYYKMVEGGTIDAIINEYSDKFHKSVMQVIKDTINQ